MPSFIDYDNSANAFRFFTLTAENPVVETSYGGATEEGFKRGWESWTLDGDNVVYSSYTQERDCDGLWTNTFDATCPLDQLAGREATLEDGTVIKVPVWTEQ